MRLLASTGHDMDHVPQHASSSRLPLRTLVAASIGNAVEWYDWTVYATFSIYFATAFFPADNEALALTNTLMVFALAFFFRPLGGWLVGRFSDVRGRRAAMLLTVTLMAGGSLLIGLLPGYGQIGWLAPALLVLARVGQSLSLGGEAASASVYLAEIAPPQRRGRYCSFFYASTGLALLFASLLGLTLTQGLSEQQLASWGWRIPFIVGGALGMAGLWLRRRLIETQQFKDNKAAAGSPRRPLLATLRQQPRAVGQLVGVTALSTLCYYTFFSALTPFAVRFRAVEPADVFLALSVATVFFIALQYPMGALSDAVGRKPQLLMWSATTALLVVPLSWLIRPGLTGLLIVFCGGLGLYTLMTSIAPAIMSELFPTEVRALGIGAWYNLTVAIFGGTAPLVISALTAAAHPEAFFWYIAVVAAMTFVIILALPETRAVELR